VRRRPFAIALVGAVLLVAASVGSAFAAILLMTLSVEAASPGCRGDAAN